MALTEEYKIKIRQLPMDIRPGATGADSGKNVCYMDWRPILKPNEPNIPLSACEFELGWDPTAQPPAWVEDPSMRFSPPPIWATSELYIQALEKENAELKAKK